ncbi:MAG TPA: chemotaxis response regulator protein-glutamate methylesterase [Sedimenticola thiotaurini]|uniref:Protein-glutamate methylesterase/protein-glutamine glutaminase n=1 Tax=Sedimenticola thiotaurini TaxID=1543721 RepID=A0A831RJX3_9GAMM|nr:chemotaxis response regulator protein-glutamate methylesterase [Sedimenticola thiotaurini]
MQESPVHGQQRTPGRRLRVLVVDDSAFFRRRISDILNRDPEIEVVGVAGDGLAAVREVHRLRPDAVTMDVEMPLLDGISAVRRIMSERPTPILMFSAMTREGARATLDALDAGALDFLPKQFSSTDSNATLLPRRLHALAGHRGLAGAPARIPATSRPSASTGASAGHHYRLLMVGASTGGPVAIQHLLTGLPADFPLPVLLVIHMPGSFTPAYAERLDGQCRIRVKEAADGDRLRPGHAYLAPGGRQMLLQRGGGDAVIRIVDGPEEQTYRPSVDITLGSAARLLGPAVLAVILTGMGSDGCQAARLLKEKGGTVWSQNEESCVVYGMPHAVEEAGLSDRVLPLQDIAPALNRVI